MRGAISPFYSHAFARSVFSSADRFYITYTSGYFYVGRRMFRLLRRICPDIQSVTCNASSLLSASDSFPTKYRLVCTLPSPSHERREGLLHGGAAHKRSQVLVASQARVAGRKPWRVRWNLARKRPREFAFSFALRLYTQRRKPCGCPILKPDAPYLLYFSDCNFLLSRKRQANSSRARGIHIYIPSKKNLILHSTCVFLGVCRRL